MTTLRISDLAICAEVSQSAVREYSDQGLLGPVPRDENSNYRVFDPRLIPQLHLLKALKNMGYTGQKLKDFAQNRTPEQSLDLFRRCSAKLQDEIADLQARLNLLNSYTSLLKEGVCAVPGIEMRELPAQPIRCSALEYYSEKTKNIERLRRAHGQIRQNGNAGCPLGFAYQDFWELLERPDQPAKLVSFDPNGLELRPAGEYLIGTERCGYGEKSALPRRMFDYVLHNGIELIGPAYSVYLLDAASVTEADQYLLQVTVRVKPNEISA